eukprot:4083139-Amphidinium_carterae.1
MLKGPMLCNSLHTHTRDFWEFGRGVSRHSGGKGKEILPSGVLEGGKGIGIRSSHVRLKWQAKIALTTFGRTHQDYQEQEHTVALCDGSGFGSHCQWREIENEASRAQGVSNICANLPH